MKTCFFLKQIILYSWMATAFTSYSFAQEPFDYFANDPEWYVHESNGNPFTDPNAWEVDVAYSMCGDTIIDEILYHKIHRRFSGETCADSNLIHFLRQDGYKVYGIEYDGFEKLLMDFDYEVGDTLSTTYFINESMNPVVESIDSVEINGNFHRKFNLIDSEISSIIEGIGSEFGTMFHTPFAIVNGGSGLKCYFQNDEFEYNPSNTECNTTINIKESIEKSLFQIYPNPAKDKFYLSGYSSSNEYTLRIFTLDGRLMCESLLPISDIDYSIDVSSWEPGVYLVKGWGTVKRLVVN